MGSYAQDDPETHFGNMSIATCAVCGRQYPINKNRKPEWHQFEDAPAYCLNHPRVHVDDHCLGVHFPYLEISPAGAKNAESELSILVHDRKEEQTEWKKNGIKTVFSKQIGKFLTAKHAGFESAREELFRDRDAEILRLQNAVDRYRTAIRDWQVGYPGPEGVRFTDPQ